MTLPLYTGTVRVVLHLCQHPSGMPSKAQGFSHGLKTVHRTVFAPASPRAGLSNPIIPIKKDTHSGVFFYGVDNGIRTHDLQSHNLTR